MTSPSEKSIKRLQKFNEALTEVLDYAERHICTDHYWDDRSNLQNRVEELEKENAELVEQNRRLIKESLGIGETHNQPSVHPQGPQRNPAHLDGCICKTCLTADSWKPGTYQDGV